MSGQVNVAGTWKNIKGIMVKRGGVWMSVKTLYQRAGGQWGVYYRQIIIPQNIIGFDTLADSLSQPTSWKFCDGTDGAPDLRSLYPRGSTNQGSVITPAPHSPPNADIVSSAFSHSYANYYRQIGSGNLIKGSHTHTFRHQSMSANSSAPAYLSLPGFVLNKKMREGVLLFYRGTSSPTGQWMVPTGYDDLFVRGSANANDAIATETTGAHTHSGSGAYVRINANLISVQLASSQNYQPALTNHSHGWTPPSATGTATPRHVQLLPIVSAVNLPKIESGTVAFFSGVAVPTGWQLCDGNNGSPDYTDLFIKLNATLGWVSDSAMGADVHTDSCPSSGSTSNRSNSVVNAYGSALQDYSNHSHTVYAHDHGSTNSSIPSNIPLLICMKV